MKGVMLCSIRQLVWETLMDKNSFILGMVTAFCECVAGGCKCLALSPPLTHADYAAVSKEAMELIKKHGLLYFHETNMDLPESERFEWILIAAKQKTIDEYLELRRAGYNPAKSLEPLPWFIQPRLSFSF